MLVSHVYHIGLHACDRASHGEEDGGADIRKTSAALDAGKEGGD